ncbi:MAG: hydrogenase maturation nickel metallochaperone HypA/HybF [bacterium JZ-2024 1]
MHELTIVREMVEKLVESAKAKGVTEIRKVKIQMSPFSGFDADDVEFSFEIVKKENPLTQNALLELEILPGKVKCQNCGHEFEVDELPSICPECDSIDLNPLFPTGIFVHSIETGGY